MKTSGIYKLVSPNGKVYIGQSWDISRRWADYYALRHNCIGRRLYNSLRKYGPENFTFEVIHRVEESLPQVTMDELEINYWKKYVDEGKLMLNSRDCGGSSGKHSEETKKLMSLASLGIPKSDKHREQLRQAKLKKPTKFWKGKSFSNSHKDKLSHAKLGKPNGRLGVLNPKASENFRKDFKVLIDGEEQLYHLSKTDLRKLLRLSLKTFNKILSGKTCKKIKPMHIYELNSTRSA